MGREVSNGSAGCQFGRMLHDQQEKDRTMYLERHEAVMTVAGELKEAVITVRAEQKVVRRLVIALFGAGGVIGTVIGLLAYFRPA